MATMKGARVRDLLRHRRSFLLLALLAGVLALAACGGGDETAEPAAPPAEAPAEPAAEPPAESAAEPPAETAAPPAEPAPEPATLKVALDWFPNPDHVSLYYALDKGMYDEQALDVSFETPSDPTAGLKLVATDKFDLAIFYEGDMFFAAQEDLPVIAVGSLVPTPLNALISPAGSKVTGPETIKGSTIGVAGLPFDDAILKAIRDTEGLSEDDVKVVNVGFDLVPALLTGKADAVIGAYRNIEGNVIQLETGKPANITPLEDLGVPHYDELLVVANRDRLADDPAYADAVSRFLAATFAGQTAAQGDEAGSIEIMNQETEYKPKEIDLMVPATLELLTSPEGLPPGCFNLDDWTTFGQWMIDNELIEKQIDPTTIATNDYLPGC